MVKSLFDTKGAKNIIKETKPDKTAAQSTEQTKPIEHS